MSCFFGKISQRVFFGKILQRVVFLGKFYNVFHFTRDEKIKNTDLEGVFIFKKTGFCPVYSVKTTNFALAIQF